MAEASLSTSCPPPEPQAQGKGRGAFIVLEGLDRSGKSTQCTRIAESIKGQGRDVEVLRFPDRSTPVGQEISHYLTNTRDMDDETIHTLFSRNRWEKKEHMEGLIQSGCSLVVDRYAFSGVAYSAAKGLDLEHCKAADAGLPAPDLVIFLQVSPEVAAGRAEYGAERYEKAEFQKQVALHYERLRDNTWKVVDASQSVDEVTRAVVECAQEVVQACGSSDPPALGKLWSHQDSSV